MGAWSLLPPLLAMLLVVWTREVVTSLGLALFASEYLLRIGQGDANPLAAGEATIDRVLAVIAAPGNARLLLFALVVGALLALMRDSGATRALVQRLSSAGVASTPRRAGAITIGTSAALFIESNLSILVSGLVSRGLFDRFGMSRARLAYLLHSFSPPICILVLMNGWGAYVLGLLNNYEFDRSSVEVLVGTIPLNFYSWFTIALVVFTVVTGRVFGPLRASEAVATQAGALEDEGRMGKARYLLLPVAVLVLGMAAMMFVTGEGRFIAGDGTRSVLYAVLMALATLWTMLRIDRVYTHLEAVEVAFKGMQELLPLVAILLLSFALGASLKELGTGAFVAGTLGAALPPVLIAPLIFLSGMLMSFATGTSWGTFALLIPIAAPLITLLELPPSLVIAAVLGGGVFGDHCSPISDTTVVASLASGCGILEHVRTQLPYALVAAAAAFLAYLVAGMLML